MLSSQLQSRFIQVVTHLLLPEYNPCPVSKTGILVANEVHVCVKNFTYIHVLVGELCMCNGLPLDSIHVLLHEFMSYIGNFECTKL